jgi:plastocyanin
VVTAALVVAVTTVGCGGGDEQPAVPELVAQDFSFQPAEFPASAGRQVTLTFSNEGEVAHNLTVPAIPVDLDFEPGVSENIIFVAPTTPGPVEFFCKFHRDQGMRGTFNVQA